MPVNPTYDASRGIAGNETITFHGSSATGSFVPAGNSGCIYNVTVTQN